MVPEPMPMPTPSGAEESSGTDRRFTFGKIWRMLAVLLLLVVGGVSTLQGLFFVAIAPEWGPPSGLPSWQVFIGIYGATGLILLSIAFWLSRRWKQQYWIRFSLTSVLVGTAALCSVMALMTRPGVILKRELLSVENMTWDGEERVHYTVQYVFRPPGWSVLQPTTGYTFSNTMPEFIWEEADRRALNELRRYYYNNADNVGADILRCVIIVLGSMYATELLLHWWRRSRTPTSVGHP